MNKTLAYLLAFSIVSALVFGAYSALAVVLARIFELPLFDVGVIIGATAFYGYLLQRLLVFVTEEIP